MEQLGVSSGIELVDRGESTPGVSVMSEWINRELIAGHFRAIVDALKVVGIEDENEIREFLESIDIDTDIPLLCSDDLKGRLTQTPWTKLDKTLKIGSYEDSELVNPSALFGMFGTLSHKVIGSVLTGNFPKQALINEDNDRFELYPDESFSDLVKPGGIIADSLLADLTLIRDKINFCLNNDSFDLAMRDFAKLYSMIYSMFPNESMELKKSREVEDGEQFNRLQLFTLLNWANAVLSTHKGGNYRPTPLFTEVASIGRWMGMRSGRIDALELIEINGKPLNDSQLRQLTNLVKHYNRYRSRQGPYQISSIGQVIGLVETDFGPNLTFALRDFKCEGGDQPKNRGTFLTSQDIADGPLPQHVKQVGGYLTLSPLDEFFQHSNIALLNSEWPKSRVSYAVLEYYIHDLLEPQKCVVQLDPEEQKNYFLRYIASRLPEAKALASHRKITNVVVNVLCHKVKGDERVSRATKRESNPNVGVQMELPLVTDTIPAIKVIAEKYRVWQDPLQIIEFIAGSSRQEAKRSLKKNVYRLHFANLVEAMKAGRIRVESGFNPDTGGFVCCPNPDHKGGKEKHGSLHIDMKGGRFHCFTCNIGGMVEDGKQRDFLTLDSDLYNGKKANWKAGAKGELAVPEGYYEAMNTVQTILIQSLEQSPEAIAYLKARGISLDFAQEYGIGFCNGEYLIQRLLNEGYGIEMLKKFGVLSLNTKTNEIYSVLRGRITFPLGTPQFGIDNFYGRSIGSMVDKGYKHRKLPTKVPQGFFNPHLVESCQSDEIIVVEGCFDAGALIEMGHRDVVALVGTGNDHALELIMGSGKRIGLGLDNDDGGRKGTQRMLEMVNEMNYTGGFYDFTEWFVQHHPDYTCKDYNEYWMQMLHLG